MSSLIKLCLLLTGITALSFSLSAQTQNVDFNINPNPACANSSVQFTDISTPQSGIISRSWYFEGGSPNLSNAANPVVTFATAGVKLCTLTVQYAGSVPIFITKTKMLTVGPALTASFTSNQSASRTFSFTPSTANITQWSWNFGDGQTSNQQTPTHTYTNEGTYNVQLSVFGPCGSTTASAQVTAVNAPTASFSISPSGGAGCAPYTANFSAAATPQFNTYQWTFPGGTPSSSTQRNPQVTWNTPGEYQATLVVTNALGQATDSESISVFNTPNSGFTHQVNANTATFSNSSTNASQYFWNFGDGQTSTATNPEHNYNNEGIYTVRLIAVNPCGSDTSFMQVMVVDPPNAGFTTLPQSPVGCAPFEVSFSGLANPQLNTIEWTFPGGDPATSNTVNQQVTWNTPGVYEVKLKITNINGVDSTTTTVTVTGAPQTTFTQTANAGTVAFTNTTAGTTQWAWNFGDGTTSNQQNPVHTYAAEGIYTVTLATAGPCGSSTASSVITVLTAPNAGFSTSSTSNNTGCAPLTISFFSQANPALNTFEWTFPGGTPATSTLPNPQVTWNTAGTYTAKLKVTNALGVDSSSVQVTANGAPQVGITYSYVSSTLTYTFIPLTLGAGTVTWDLGDGTTSTENSPVHTYVPGIYTVVATISGPCGSSTSSGTIVVSGPPNASFSTSSTSNNTGCAPLAISFFSQADPALNTFEWTFQGGTPATSNLPNPTVVWEDPGVFEAKLKVTNAFGVDSSSVQVTANGGPYLSYFYGVDSDTVTFGSNTINASGVLWQFGDGTTSTEANPVHTYTPGTYNVTLTAFGACDSTTTTFTVQVGSSSVNNLEIVPVKVSPNPTADGVTLLLPEAMVASGTTLYLHSADGQLKQTQVTQPGDNQIWLEMNALPAGYYILNVQTKEKVGSVKIVKF